MFTLQIGPKKVAFTFSHEHFPQPTPLSGRSALVKAQTLCALTVDDVTVYEWAYCSIHDTFDKEVGRKAALTKALRRSSLSRQERGRVWARYHLRYTPNELWSYDDSRIPPDQWSADDLCESTGRNSHIAAQGNHLLGAIGVDIKDEGIPGTEC